MLQHCKKHFSILLFALFSSFLLPSCEVQPNQVEVPQAVLQGEEFNEGEEPCLEEVGQTMAFDLQITQDPAEAPQFTSNIITDYVFLGPVPPYKIGEDCLCQLSKYGLLFDIQPSPSELFLYDNNGNEIAWSGPFLSSNNTHWVVEVGSAYLEQHINVAFSPTTSPLPDLLRAGGLCMVDNVALPTESFTRNEVLETYLPGKDGLSMERVFLIGANAGTPSSPPHF